MFKLSILKLQLKYFIFNYNRYYRWGVESPYYKKKVNITKKEIAKLEKQLNPFSTI